MIRRVALVILLLAAAAQAGAADDVATIKANIIRALLPTAEADPKPLVETARKFAASLRDDGAWPDIAYDDAARTHWAPREHLQRLLAMAKASRLAPENEISRATLRGLDYWLARDFQNPNWWWNEIGVPQLLGETALLADDKLSPSQRERVVEILQRSNWSKWTGQNLVWGVGIQIARGCIEDDAAVVGEAFTRMYNEVQVAAPGKEGIQADYSFHQHGSQLYSGGYGLAFGNDVGRFVTYAWGTRFQIPPERMTYLTRYLLDGQQWMIRGRTFDYSAVGREIVRKGKAAVTRDWRAGPIAPAGAAYGLASVVTTLSKLNVPRSSELENFAAHLIGVEQFFPFTGNKHFWRSDYMAHHRKGFFASVRMFSTRTLNTEFVNDEGRKSHHLADGAMLLYRDGDEYRDVFPAWDWNKIPGTTAEVAPDGNPETVLPRGNRAVRGTTRFVGGASDGTSGVAAMQLARGKLRTTKGWFFFEDVVVCLGAGVACDTENVVVTSVNQCLARGDVTIGSHGDRQWLHHDNVLYVFPAAAKLAHTLGPQSGRWSDIGTQSDALVTLDVFNLWIDHGTRPNEGAYEYAVVPGLPRDSVSAEALPRYGVLSNTPRVQAVADGRHLGAIFHANGQVKRGDGERLSADVPCIVLLRDLGNGRVAITVSNPVNEPLGVMLRTSRALAGPNTQASDDGTTIRFDLPDGPAAGSSVTKVFTMAK